MLYDYKRRLMTFRNTINSAYKNQVGNEYELDRGRQYHCKKDLQKKNGEQCRIIL